MNISAFLSDLVGKRVEVMRRASDSYDNVNPHWTTEYGWIRGVGADDKGVVLIVELRSARYFDVWPTESMIAPPPILDGKDVGHLLMGAIALYRWDWHLRVRVVSDLEAAKEPDLWGYPSPTDSTTT